MIASIHQPQYLPWLGYLDKIDQADLFILLDTVQFARRSWQQAGFDPYVELALMRRPLEDSGESPDHLVVDNPDAALEDLGLGDVVGAGIHRQPGALLGASRAGPQRG